MVARALEWLDVQPEDRVLDLFCGMGNFTLPLATRAASVVGVEGVPALVDKGRENALNNGLHNVTFFHENLEEDVTRQPWAKNGFDKVLLDPARAGAAGVMQHIIKLKPGRVVYVSCNPATLARDSEALLNAGYTIQRLAMLDMFPHTGHTGQWSCLSIGNESYTHWISARSSLKPNGYGLSTSTGRAPKERTMVAVRSAHINKAGEFDPKNGSPVWGSPASSRVNA